MATCDVYWKGKIKLGSGSIESGATSVTGYTSLDVASEQWKNVVVTITSSTHAGSSFRTRIITDGGTSLTLKDASPFAT